MKIKFYLSVLMSFVLVYSQMSFAIVKPTGKFRKFNQSDIKILSKITDTHRLAQAVLKTKDSNPMLSKESKNILEKKQFKLTDWKLKGQDLAFNYESKTYVIKYLQHGRYKIGPDIIDFNLKDLGLSSVKSKTSQNLMNYLVPEAHAAIPLLVWYLGAMVVAVVVTSGCLNISLTAFFGEDTVPDAKFLENNFISREFRNLRRKLKLDQIGCAVNAGSIVDDNLDFESVVRQACSMKRKGLDPKEELEATPEKYELEYCLDEECLNKQGGVYFNQLDELNRNLIFGFIQDEAFMNRACDVQNFQPSFKNSNKKKDSKRFIKVEPKTQIPQSDTATVE